eukprot:jgi/Tetstr1/457963/TSEL_044476.t1
MKVVEKAHKETQAQLGSGGLINSMKAVGYFEEEGRLRYNPEPLFTDQIRDFNPRGTGGGTLSQRPDADGAAAQQNRADREERLQKSFWNNRRESEGTTELKELEGGLEHAKAALKDAKAARKAKAQKARMMEVEIKTATKKLEVHAKRVEECLAAGNQIMIASREHPQDISKALQSIKGVNIFRHSRHVFITLSLRRIINRLLVTAYLAGPDALRAARRCRSILARAAAKSANRTFSTMGACGNWLLEGLRS